MLLSFIIDNFYCLIVFDNKIYCLCILWLDVIVSGVYSCLLYVGEILFLLKDYFELLGIILKKFILNKVYLLKLIGWLSVLFDKWFIWSKF